MSDPVAALKAKALRLLAIRDHSRVELRRKLVHEARRLWMDHPDKTGHHRIGRHEQLSLEAGSSAAESFETESEEAGRIPDGLLRDIDTLLDKLEASGILDSNRFVESRIRTRSPRFGTRIILAELRRHGLEAGLEAAEALSETEFARAFTVWRQRFGNPADSAKERARQFRFLERRGFSASVIARIVLQDERPDDLSESGRSGHPSNQR